MYREQKKIRAANRSQDAAALIRFLSTHGAARAIIAKQLHEAGEIPMCDGTTWPKDASGQGWVYWKTDEPYPGIVEGQAEFKLVTALSLATALGHTTRRGREFRHRLLVKCQNCGAWIPTGRFHQHAGARSCDAKLKYMR